MSLSVESIKVWLEESGQEDKDSISAVIMMMNDDDEDDAAAAIVSTLESNVLQQFQGDIPYCFHVNKCLIKLYQVHPQLLQQQEQSNTNNTDYYLIQTTARILFLSMLEFPSTDILALSCIIPQRIQDAEPCATILRYVFFIYPHYPFLTFLTK